MITEAHGNLLTADVDALVNTVNTVGIMGKGIALQFKRAHPTMFTAYAAAAKRGELHLGQMHVWETGQMTGPRFIINFPTKGHWKAGSRLGDVDRGLDDLVRVIREHGIRSVALPPLGCGNGGLDWAVVRPLIHRKLAELTDVDIVVYPPEGAPQAAEMVTAGPVPTMSPGRAALVRLVADYATHAQAFPGLIETQKLMYFLQEAGEPLHLDYVKGHYGPYADNLRSVLSTVEGHYLSGFGDGSAPVTSSEPLAVLPGALEAAEPVIAAHEETARRIQRVLHLIEGFESAYGMELLASVYWLTQREPDTTGDDQLLIDHLQRWNPRKGRMFGREHILTAADALRDRGWLETPVVA